MIESVHLSRACHLFDQATALRIVFTEHLRLVVIVQSGKFVRDHGEAVSIDGHAEVTAVQYFDFNGHCM